MTGPSEVMVMGTCGAWGGPMRKALRKTLTVAAVAKYPSSLRPSIRSTPSASVVAVNFT